MAKLTQHRQVILDLINDSNHHWDAEELARALIERGSSMGIATVYRGLAALESQGLISAFQMADRKRYERASKAHHDHLVCTGCGKIQEFFNDDIEQQQDRVAEENSFTITGHQLVIFGTCNNCS
ncbi:transcriptional repressor [Mariprofundus sp. NF]|uniref:Fur family transcriptional regulator n=1 Tax=Mariprofundus sp. NF TaxID=2608716 RepID=UPI0015A01633|nr:transcriptional repressor [Mariprofundus sp. NF]NWF39645.1 transcriptional repressor [Mariprofundus sp. NF]